MKRSSFLLMIVLLIICMYGCLTVETISVRVRYDDIKQSATIDIEYFDLSSDAKSDESLKDDFDSLIKDAEGQEYVDDRAEAGIIIEKRQLTIIKDKIVGRETGMVKDLERFNKTIDFTIVNGQRQLTISQYEEIVETNGKIIKNDKGSSIVWPLSEKELYWKTRNHDTSDSIVPNRQKLISMLKEHQKMKK